eukprot:5793377-Pleurochrysis_carterae.AAC.1
MVSRCPAPPSATRPERSTPSPPTLRAARRTHTGGPPPRGRPSVSCALASASPLVAPVGL